MDDKALDKANIDNLTALWRAMGTRAASGVPGLHASAGWPDRCWFDWGEEPAAPAGDLLAHLPPTAMVPVWAADERNSPLEQALVRDGFAVCLEQRAMHLNLDGWTGTSPAPLQLARVTSLSQVESWTGACSRAFGYRIDVAPIRRIARDPAVRLLQARVDGRLAATALLYKTGGVIGVHQLGVLPEYRGRGVAGALMRNILAACREWQGRFVTLQSSVAGEGLYRKLGFVPRFNIRSYRRPGP